MEKNFKEFKTENDKFTLNNFNDFKIDKNVMLLNYIGLYTCLIKGEKH